ncbi:dimethyl sulfoxide reductase anchor subunit [Campylobacter sp. RM12327]|uniref:DmsC/YnfH family molybdoenzyme membrane anchor subunit n=1 Tax=Campylobacter sputorum TaxID=206 RepID=UPI000B76C7D4|nr:MULTISPECIES: DmsC/YnfH family molybdoenzyme membrane anchor subunit [Campylobacter]ASM40837.1 dimethyl sulfoxide reductase, subunit C [Campylobacter sputorum]MBE7357855.1 dimethyl sulfoxide reductase anchor subunit [Campylobacter sp. RM11302]MBF6669718.1 dimethyl sulfoxide reductase anchor subunit [Campylobacter sp. RM12327]MBF6674861.1 dimethyl sulfoxide reductase anchor subunit [Campylobacter sp. RM13538]MBF6675701.1 dimethyl sulfoxide reductase anchor subunit [Campylobacter sp. RM12321]
MILFDIIAAEIPLLFFTVFAQAIIGLVFVYTPAYYQGIRTNIKKFGIFTTIAMGIAMLPSLFHLGDITHSLNFIRRMGVFYANHEWHIGWMNNEVAFAGLVLLFALLLWYKNNKIFLYLALISGILCIFFMAGAYGSMQRTVTTWRFDVTLINFYACMFFLGGLMYHTFFAKEEHEEKMAFLVGLFGGGMLLVAIVFQTLHLGNVQVAGIINPFDLLQGNYSKFIFLGAMLVGLAMTIWYFNIYLRNKSKIIAGLALIIGILGILAIRAIFYGLVNTHVML